MRVGAVQIALGVAAVALTAAGLAVVLLAPGPLAGIGALGLMVIGLAGLYAAFSEHRRRRRDIERLRAEVMAIDPARPRLARHWHDPARMDPVSALARSVADMLGLMDELGRRPDRRLEAVIETLVNGVLVINGDGLVTLVNAPAAGFLGQDRIRVGTSVFGALERHDVLAAMSEAGGAGGPVQVRIGLLPEGAMMARAGPIPDHRGLVLVFDALEQTAPMKLVHDLSLHDVPPEGRVAAPETSLDDLPWLCLDTETTGLDVAKERVLSIGAVRGHGRRLYAHIVFDDLVNPRMPIPPRSTAVHGLTDTMVEGADPFAQVQARLRPLLEGCAIVGHNVAFDLAIMQAECRRNGIRWQPGPSLDTFALAALLLPEQESFTLDRLAEELDVEVRGRHTALGDSLVTAEVYLKLVPRLHARGIHTLGAALQFCARASAIRQQERTSRWGTHGDEPGASL